MPTTTSSTDAHRITVRAASDHVRIEIAGEVIAESRRPLLLEETRCPPRWYLPRADVRLDRLARTATRTHCPYKGDATYWSVRVGDRVVADAAWSYEEPLPEREDIRGHLCFYPGRVDAFLIDGQPLDRS